MTHSLTGKLFIASSNERLESIHLCIVDNDNTRTVSIAGRPIEARYCLDFDIQHGMSVRTTQLEVQEDSENGLCYFVTQSGSEYLFSGEDWFEVDVINSTIIGIKTASIKIADGICYIISGKNTFTLGHINSSSINCRVVTLYATDGEICFRI